jgi:uncharacterized protein involved in exopolysaccharide biosynthesis
MTPLNLPARQSLQRAPETGVVASDAQRAIRAANAQAWDPAVHYARLDPIVDVARLRQLLLFPVGALWRRRMIALFVFGAVVAATVVAMIVLPRTYYVQSRILARRNVVMPALGNPRRTIPGESDAPTRMATEAVMSRENLLNIIQTAKLLEDWEKIMSPAARAKRFLVEAIKGPMSETDRINALVGMLERYMWVATNEGNEGTVTIGVGWRNPESALRIVQVAQQNFIERRYASEVSLIGESITILERYVGDAREAIEESMADSRPAGGGASRAAIAAEFALPPRQTAASRARADEIAGLQSSLRAKEDAIADLEGTRLQRINDQQAKLAGLRNRYGSAHPEVTAVEEDLRTLSAESPQLEAMRAEAKTFRDRLTELGATAFSSPSSEVASSSPAVTRESVERWMRQREDSLDSPRVTYARSRLKIAITNYEDLLDRLEAARIELETARAAFKYRYTVISPPQLPKEALTPNVKLILVGGVMLAVMLAVFSTTALDLISGRIVESWQVDRHLGLPVLGEVR